MPYNYPPEAIYQNIGAKNPSLLETLLTAGGTGLQTFLETRQKEQERIQKQQKHQFEKFKTLREMNYPTSIAAELSAPSNMGNLPTTEPPETLEQQKTKLELEELRGKIVAGPKVSKAEVEGSILQKKALGQSLTAGEQQIYEDSLVRRGADTDEKRRIYEIAQQEALREITGSADDTTLLPGFFKKTKAANLQRYQQLIEEKYQALLQQFGGAGAPAAMPEFDTLEEAEAAGLPKGTKVKIGGKPFEAE